jgi:hypothetical protein
MNPADAAKKALAEFDANKDGYLDAAELEKCPGLKAGLASMDADKDKRLSAAEIADRVREYHSDKAGLLLLSLQVALDGKPLAGADVTLTPEPFLGGAVRLAKGTTDAGGACTPRLERGQYPGIHPGFFRIAISRKDAAGAETVPAKFNTETTLGIEARQGNPVLRNGLMLTLSSK